MNSKETNFIKGEYYHIYNRGVDKRNIFLDQYDVKRFLQSMREFNVKNPIGSLYEQQFAKPFGGKTSKLVKLIAYCLNPNHYHLILTPLVENGIEKFMQRLGTGYTMYFNEKNRRSGSLFEGKFKRKHIDSNKYLLQVVSYVNLNNYDKQGKLRKSLNRSSWAEYTQLSNDNLCEKSIVLDQFEARKDYEEFALDAWRNTCLRKEQLKELEFNFG